MQNACYIFRDFKLFPDNQSGALFYTPEISAHIKNLPLINLLNEVKRESLSQLDESAFNDLINKHQLSLASVKEYLINDLKIVSVKDPESFENLFICSDDIRIKNDLMSHFQNKCGMTVSCEKNKISINEKTLIFKFNSCYVEESNKEIYKICHQYNAWLITSYVINNFLIIDNIYNPQKATPCHFCNFYRYQNIVSSTNSIQSTSWINFCRALVSQKIPIIPAMNLTKIEMGLILFWLAKTIKHFISSQGPTLMIDDLTKYKTVNLITGEVSKEQAVHWIYCTCLKG